MDSLISLGNGNVLGAITDYFYWWQWLLMLAMVGLIVLWVVLRKRGQG